MTVHPAITAFQDLELLDMNRQVLRSNAEDLVNKARQAIQANSFKAYIPPLALLCIERLRQNGYGMSESTRHLQANRYTCANCKETIWSEDPHSIPTPLRERYYHFDPPIAALTVDGRLPPGTSKMTRELTDPEWQFCAPCLIKHCNCRQEDEGGCNCVACHATRKMWQERKVIRWFKLPVALA